MVKKIIKSNAFQTFLASLLCVVLGFLIGYIVLLLINPAGAGDAITAILKNFLNFKRPPARLKYLGTTLVKTAPLLMCALSVMFSYKVGLFNIGSSGQYTAGACACLYAALAWGWGWFPCMLFAMLSGAVLGTFVGWLKSTFRVNEVISGIMLNWISLYSANMILSMVKEPSSPYTCNLRNLGKAAILPSLGLEKLFHNNRYVTIAIPLSVIITIVLYIVLEKTVFGYELKASGLNRNAANYAGMNSRKNMVLSLAISGALSGLGASFLYQSGIEQWCTTASSVPGIGFNGIAATFLGGLNPIGTIFASYFIEHITLGGAYVDKTIYCSQISDLIIAFIIYFCGFVLFTKSLIQKALDRSRQLNKSSVRNFPSGENQEGAVSC